MDGIAHGTHGGTTMNGSASRLAPLAYGYQYRDMAGLAGVTRWLLSAHAALTAVWLAERAFGYAPFLDDRTSRGWGKGVAVRGDFGGRRILKKKKKQKT